MDPSFPALVVFEQTGQDGLRGAQAGLGPHLTLGPGFGDQLAWNLSSVKDRLEPRWVPRPLSTSNKPCFGLPDFQRMQDIPEEIESSQDPNAGEDGSPDS